MQARRTYAPPLPGGIVSSRPRATNANAARADLRARDRLRLDLHDRLGPRLASLEVKLELLAEAAGEAADGAELIALRDEVAWLVRELRRIVHDEPPESLEHDGLESALRGALALVARTGLAVQFSATGTPGTVPPAVAELLYRVALEGTANVVRHSHARRCWVTLRVSEERALLVIRDDGVGPLGVGGPAGIGLASLRDAARRANGTLHLLRGQEGGTSLVVRVPLHGPVRARRAGGRRLPVTGPATA